MKMLLQELKMAQARALFRRAVMNLPGYTEVDCKAFVPDTPVSVLFMYSGTLQRASVCYSKMSKKETLDMFWHARVRDNKSIQVRKWYEMVARYPGTLPKKENHRIKEQGQN